MNLTKQKLSQYNEPISINVIAESIMRELFYTYSFYGFFRNSNKPINMNALEKFYTTYSSNFTYDDGVIDIRKA